MKKQKIIVITHVTKIISLSFLLFFMSMSAMFPNKKLSPAQKIRITRGQELIRELAKEVPPLDEQEKEPLVKETVKIVPTVETGMLPIKSIVLEKAKKSMQPFLQQKKELTKKQQALIEKENELTRVNEKINQLTKAKKPLSAPVLQKNVIVENAPSYLKVDQTKQKNREILLNDLNVKKDKIDKEINQLKAEIEQKKNILPPVQTWWGQFMNIFKK
ncbi:MAG TPA: hypothetical protein VLB80_04975 [Candidatus Babeliales bacterium]|nr:hypothetical protein [Candidatus Babeliales bacterium]